MPRSYAEKVDRLRIEWQGLGSEKSAEEAVRLLAAVSRATAHAGNDSVGAGDQRENFSRELIAFLRPHLPALPLNAIGNLALSCTTLRIGDPAFVSALARGAAQHLPTNREDSGAYSRVAHLLTLRKAYVPEFFNAVSYAVVADKLPFDIRSLVSLAGAFAEVDPKRQGTLAILVKTIAEGELSDDLKELSDDLNSQRRFANAIDRLHLLNPEVALALGGEKAAREVGTTRVAPGAVLAWFHRAGLTRVTEANRKAAPERENLKTKSLSELGSLGREFGSWGVDSKELVREFIYIVESKLQHEATLRPRDALGILNFLAPHAANCPKLIAALCKDLPENGEKLGLQESLLVLRAMHYGHVFDEKVLGFLAQKFTDGVSFLDRSALPNIMASFSALNFDASEFFSAAQSRMIAELPSLSKRDLKRDLPALAWAAAKMNYSIDGFNRALFDQVAERLDLLDPRAAVLCTWSAAVVDVAAGPDLCRRTLGRLARDPQLFDDYAIRQLYQATLAFGFDLEQVKGGDVLSIAVNKLFAIDKAITPEVNDFEKRVGETLTSLGIEFKAQHFVAGYTLDLMVEIGGRQFAIECDGTRVHQVGRNDQARLRGNYLLRDRILEGLGITTLRINDHDWYMRTHDQQEELVRQLLSAQTPSTPRLGIAA